MFEETDPTINLAYQMIQEGLKYGIWVNCMHSISQEQHPKAEWPQTDVNIIGQEFNLTNTMDKYPNTNGIVAG